MVEKYFAMVWRRKKKGGGGGFPSRFRAHLFLLSCYFLFIFAPTFCPRFFFFIAIVALIDLMAQFCFRFSTLFATPIPHKSIFLGCTISCKSSFSKLRHFPANPPTQALFYLFLVSVLSILFISVFCSRLFSCCAFGSL